MAHIKPIRSAADHQQALERIGALMGAQVGSPEADELAVLADLVEAYEAVHFPIARPTPVEAIRFRMEQAGLKQRDLRPFIGSRSRVSEVLSGKQPLTLDMIRALNQHLGISADLLIGSGDTPAMPDQAQPLALAKLPLKEMQRRGWIGSSAADAADGILRLVSSIGGLGSVPAPLYRRNDGMRQNATAAPAALLAWSLRVLARARQQRPSATYREGALTEDAVMGLAKLSAREDGPLQARHALAELGIRLVCVAHLPRTYLDGAALWPSDDGGPIVALTLRHDRVDNFWFSLMHELAHVSCHLTGGSEAFVDDLSLRSAPAGLEDPREAEADAWATDALIPRHLWVGSDVSRRPTTKAIRELAAAAGIHPAIVAGRIQHETRNFRAFAQMVGRNSVHKQFADFC